jgi:hypothetical protein
VTVGRGGAKPLAVADHQITQLALRVELIEGAIGDLVQGTNSKFILIPLSAVKSLDSSASAFAGSQTAQQSVSSWSCALAALTDGARAEAATAARVSLVRSMRCPSV